MKLFVIVAYTSIPYISIDHLEGVKSRLDTMEKTMSQLSSMMAELMTNPARKEQTVSVVPTLEAKETRRFGPAKGRNSAPDLKSIVPVFDKQYYGSSSLTSLIGKICSSLQDCVRSDEDCCMNDGSESSADGSLQECMTMMEGMEKSLEMERRLDQSSDGQPLTLPPRELLDAFVEIYFNQINWMLPLFHKDTFSENVRRSYELGRDASDAWILCFNGIVLLILNIRALGSSKKAADDAMEADLIKPFHANFRRGLNEMQSLLEPSLVNVQALILMVSSHSRRATPTHRPQSRFPLLTVVAVFDRPRKFPDPTVLSVAPPSLFCGQVHWPSSAGSARARPSARGRSA